LLVKLSDIEKSSNKTGCGDKLLYFRQETGATDEMTEKSESDVSEAVREECDASDIKGCSVLSLDSKSA
jgi:hypothetical protein